MDETALLRKHLELLLPMFGPIRRCDADKVLDTANECLKHTPFMFLLMADGVNVVLRQQMVQMAKVMFDKPYSVYGG